jgi:DNA-binding MarR family transcriptional regulator
MASSPGKKMTAQPEDHRELAVLEAIDKSPDINQRNLAKETRMALGLVNSYLKRLIRKGLVKIKEAPGRRYLYYLTPKGLTEKSRLTYEYMFYSIQFYGKARKQCQRCYEEYLEQKIRRIAFLGCSELAEIAYLTLQEYDLGFAGIYDSTDPENLFFGHKINNINTINSGKQAFDLLLYTWLKVPEPDGELKGIEFRELF